MLLSNIEAVSVWSVNLCRSRKSSLSLHKHIELKSPPFPQKGINVFRVTLTVIVQTAVVRLGCKCIHSWFHVRANKFTIHIQKGSSE